MAKCSECGTEVDESASFCEKCGNEITTEVAQNREEDNLNESVVKCSECGAEVDESSSFCSNCGAEVTADESHRAEESHEESQTDEGQGPSYVKWRSGWWTYSGAMISDESGITIKKVETELGDITGSGDMSWKGYLSYLVYAAAIPIADYFNIGAGFFFLVVVFLVSRYGLYGTGGMLHDKKVGEMEESEAINDSDLRIQLSEVEEAKHKSKMFPLLRDIGKLSLSTADGEKYIIRGPDEHLQSVYEKWSSRHTEGELDGGGTQAEIDVETEDDRSNLDGVSPSYVKWRSGWWSSRGGLLVQGDEIKMKQPALNSNNWLLGLLLSIAIAAGLVSSFVFPLYGIVFLATVVFVAIYAMYPAALIVLVLFMPLSPIVVGVIALLGGIYVMYGDVASLQGKRIKELKNSDVANNPDVEISLSDVESAEYESKVMPLLRDVAQLKLTTRDEDKYIIRSSEEHLESVSERIDG